MTIAPTPHANRAGSFDPAFGPNQNGTLQIDLPGLTRLMKDQTFITVVIKPDQPRGVLIESIKHSSAGHPIGLLPDPLHVGERPLLCALAVQADGKYLLLWALRQDSHDAALITRFTHTGELDRTFNPDSSGTVALNVPVSTVSWTKYSLQIRESDNAIFAAFATSETDSAIFKVNTNGTLANDFGNNGHVHVHNTTLHDLTLASKNTVLVAGNNTHKAIVACYTDAGLPDESFGVNGVAELALQDDPENTRSAFGLSVDTRQRIAVVGSNAKLRQTRNFLTRLTQQGHADLSFNNGLPFETGMDDGSYTSVIVQQDEKIVVLAREQAKGVTTHLLRFTQDGSKDLTFGNNGVALAYSRLQGPGQSDVYTLESQADGKLVVSGANSIYYSYVARLLNDIP
jgi:uncharacterized delta-60 repeat protein